MKYIAVLVGLFSFSSFAQVIVSDATPATLDASIATRNFVFTSGDFSGCSSLTEVEVDLTLTVTDNGSCNPGGFGVHSDIAVSLESPSGTVVHLVQDFAGILLGSPPVQITYQDAAYPNIVSETATYDDDAALLADDQTSFGAGTWRPHNPLSAFDGEDPAGTWILRVADGRSQGFPDFTCYIGASVSIQCGSLPVELTSFDAEQQERSVLLNWKTQTEKDNKGFLLEKSTDLLQWDELTFVEGVGNSNVKNQYSYRHHSPTHGLNYYRLTQIDFDGSRTEFKIQSVDFSSGAIQMDILPNPNNGHFRVRSTSWTEGEELQFFILDNEGKVCFEEVFRAVGKSREMNVNTLQPGVYTMRCIGDSFVSHEKFVVRGQQ